MSPVVHPAIGAASCGAVRPLGAVECVGVPRRTLLLSRMPARGVVGRTLGCVRWSGYEDAR